MRWIDNNRFETLLPMVVLDPSGEVERFTLSEGIVGAAPGQLPVASRIYSLNHSCLRRWL